MAYTNSPLVSYTRISPNRTINRNHAIDTITIHCVVGQCSVETLGNIFAPESRQASCNYGIGADGRIGMYCEEKDRSWCSSNAANDHRAVTIEVASDTKHPYAVNDKAYAALIDLCTDICKRNGIKKLLWKADKSLIGQVDKQNMTVHRWFANKSCPGDYLYNRHSEIAELVNKRISTDEKADAKGLQAPVFKDMAEADVIKKVGSLFTADQKASGVLASVSLAQFILESGYGKSELAQNANNVFGIENFKIPNAVAHEITQEELQRDFDYYRAQKVLETMFMFGMISVDEFHKISAVNRKTFSPFLAEIMG